MGPVIEGGGQQCRKGGGFRINRAPSREQDRGMDAKCSSNLKFPYPFSFTAASNLGLFLFIILSFSHSLNIYVPVTTYPFPRIPFDININAAFHNTARYLHCNFVMVNNITIHPIFFPSLWLKFIC